MRKLRLKNVMTPNNQIKALLNLIEDPDEDIFIQVKNELVFMGIDVIPNIEKAWEKNPFGKNYLTKLENIIHEIQFKDIYNSLNNWKETGAINLLDGVLLVNKFQYPELNRKKVEKQLNTIIQDAKIQLSDHMTGLEKITILNHIIYKVHGFHGNKDDYYSPSNSFLTSALDRKKGNALILAIIYLEIANRLYIPLKGINLPNHFILGYPDRNQFEKYNKKRNSMLFYINAFSSGNILSKMDINEFLDKIKLEHKPEYYTQCTNREIIKRLITNLKYSHKKLGAKEKMKELELLLSIFQ